MKKKWLAVLIFSGVLILALAACGSDPGEAVVGTWVSVEHYIGEERAEEMEGMTIEFRDDGSARTSLGTGTFVFEDDTVVFTSDRGDEVKYEMVDDQLTVETLIARIIYERAD